MASASDNVCAVKFIKTFSKYTEGEMVAAMGAESEQDVRQLLATMRRLTAAAGESRPTEEVPAVKEKRKEKASKEDQFKRVLEKVESELQKYEQKAASTDVWNISFPVGERFETKTLTEIFTVHDKILNAQHGIECLNLLAASERGRMYAYLKSSENRCGNWVDVCKTLGICRVTADRYIDYHRVIQSYPRLLICNVGFATTLRMFKQLNEHLQHNYELANRLKEPLKSVRVPTRCEGDKQWSYSSIHAERLPGFTSTGETPEPPSSLASAKLDWGAGWEIKDEVQEI